MSVFRADATDHNLVRIIADNNTLSAYTPNELAVVRLACNAFRSASYHTYKTAVLRLPRSVHDLNSLPTPKDLAGFHQKHAAARQLSVRCFLSSTRPKKGRAQTSPAVAERYTADYLKELGNGGLRVKQLFVTAELHTVEREILDAQAQKADSTRDGNHYNLSAELPAQALCVLLHSLPGLECFEISLQGVNPPGLDPGAEVYFYRPSTPGEPITYIKDISIQNIVPVIQAAADSSSKSLRTLGLHGLMPSGPLLSALSKLPNVRTLLTDWDFDDGFLRSNAEGMALLSRSLSQLEEISGMTWESGIVSASAHRITFPNVRTLRLPDSIQHYQCMRAVDYPTLFPKLQHLHAPSNRMLQFASSSAEHTNAVLHQLSQMPFASLAPWDLSISMSNREHALPRRREESDESSLAAGSLCMLRALKLQYLRPETWASGLGSWLQNLFAATSALEKLECIASPEDIEGLVLQAVTHLPATTYKLCLAAVAGGDAGDGLSLEAHTPLMQQLADAGKGLQRVEMVGFLHEDQYEESSYTTPDGRQVQMCVQGMTPRPAAEHRGPLVPPDCVIC